MPMINGFMFAEDGGNKSPVCRWAAENHAVQRRLYLPYTADPDRLNLAALALLGGTELRTEDVDGQTRAWIHRELPDAYAATPTYENPLKQDFLYAVSIPSAEPTSKPEGVDADTRSVYTWYRFTVNYETLAYNVLEDDDVLATGLYADAQGSPLAAVTGPPAIPARPDEGDALRRGWRGSRWVIKEVNPASRTVSLRQGFVKYQNVEGKPVEAIPEGLAYTQARLTVAYHWLCVPIEAVPETEIQFTLGRVNQRDFDRWPLGTLLLADAKQRQYRSATGRRVADLSYHCLYLPNRDSVTGEYRGWNSALRVVDGAVRCWPISGDGLPINPNVDSTNKVFQHNHFDRLFRPPWPYVA